MAGIAGIDKVGERKLVQNMLDIIAHRGGGGRKVMENENATMGIVWPEAQSHLVDSMEVENSVQDAVGNGHVALARVDNENLILMRDQLGLAPLYKGVTPEGVTCFASEVKALLDFCNTIEEVCPGTKLVGGKEEIYFKLEEKDPVTDSAETIASELRKRLEHVVKECIGYGGTVGSWLSGGLDSSTLAALASRHVDKLYTIVSGVKGAPDIKYAREMAEFIKSDHHEAIIDLKGMLDILPDVIFHLESFDALLVRSSITNFHVAGKAAEYVDAVFSGEAGDELFAGYEYLKSLEKEKLSEELSDITGRLHNTAFQRVDRCASAHGTFAHVVFSDPDIVDYALRIPVEYKIHNSIEKWILRQAMVGVLPESVLWRKKAKFWEGAGVSEMIASHANTKISDREFLKNRTLPSGEILNSKEEMLYFNIFKDHFGELDDLSWMGRTKGAPEQNIVTE